MYTYDKLFTEHGHTVAQLLLTADDIQDPRRSEKVHDTLQQLVDWKAIPIINENDAVSTDEIGIHTTIGENDTLSAIVARLMQADLLVLLSDIQGLYTADPHKDPTATLIPVVEELT
jgi:glutamate 5-kinase